MVGARTLPLVVISERLTLGRQPWSGRSGSNHANLEGCRGRFVDQQSPRSAASRLVRERFKALEGSVDKQEDAQLNDYFFSGRIHPERFSGL
jgi:hypothetical protein